MNFDRMKFNLLTDWYWVINVLTVAITDVRITMFACTSTISDVLQVWTVSFMIVVDCVTMVVPFPVRLELWRT